MPAFNEAPNLAEIVPRTLACCGRPRRFEIVVVDDGSRDGTAELMAELGKDHPELRLLRLRRNYGKSTALQAGFDHARGEVIVLMDADGQDQPEEIPRLAPRPRRRPRPCHRPARNAQRPLRKAPHLAPLQRVTATVTGVSGKDFNQRSEGR